MRNTILFIAFILCFSGTANAQFLKKLTKKIENAAEKTVERKAEQKTKKETEKVFDSAFNKEGKKKRKNGGIPGLSTVEPAEKYTFSHKVEMQIKSGKDVMDVDYFLPDSGNFLGTVPRDKKMKGGFITVLDIDRDAMFSYMENDGKKMKMGVNFETDEATDNASDEPSFDITATGNSKNILGYNCLEYKMAGEDMTATLWVTKDVDIRFPSKFHSVKQNKTNNQEWMKDVDGWTMEMVMIDTSRRKAQTITMNCLSIEESNFEINSNDYKNIGEE